MMTCDYLYDFKVPNDVPSKYRIRIYDETAARLERTFFVEILPENAPPAAVHVMPRNRARLGVRRCEEHITEPCEQGFTGTKSVLAYRL